MARGRGRMLKVGDLVRILEQLGFRKARQVGSHAFYTHPDGRVTTVSIHPGEDIGRGLLRKILRDIELPPEDFLKLI